MIRKRKKEIEIHTQQNNWFAAVSRHAYIPLLRNVKAIASNFPQNVILLNLASKPCLGLPTCHKKLAEKLHVDENENLLT